MPVISITRLRVRSWAYLPPFAVQTLRSAFQAARSDGNLAMNLLREPGNTFWTCTSWSSEAAMKAFMHAKPHGPTMRRLLEWCDEAALVHWTQEELELPTWKRRHKRIQKMGGVRSEPSVAGSRSLHRSRPPVVRRTGMLRFK